MTFFAGGPRIAGVTISVSTTLILLCSLALVFVGFGTFAHYFEDHHGGWISLDLTQPFCYGIAVMLGIAVAILGGLKLFLNPQGTMLGVANFLGDLVFIAGTIFLFFIMWASGPYKKLW